MAQFVMAEKCVSCGDTPPSLVICIICREMACNSCVKYCSGCLRYVCPSEIGGPGKVCGECRGRGG